MGEIDYDILSDYTNEEDFLNELNAAEKYLQLSQCKTFFKTVLSHFKARVPENIGNSILNTIHVLISNQQYLNKFAVGSFINDLPFRQKNLTEKLLDILYILTRKAPHAFDEDTAELFSRLIPRNPSKTLVLLTMYAQSMSDLTDPWPMVDNLFNGESYFADEELCEDYVSILGFLYESIPLFRSRGEEAMKVVGRALANASESGVIEACYGSMCRIAAHEESVSLPLGRIRADLKDAEHCASAVRVLLSAPVESVAAASTDGRLARALLRAAQDNGEAALAVMRLCSDEGFSGSLTEFTAWMEAELPTAESTLQIFLCAFQHKRLRKKLAAAPEFPALLQAAVDAGDAVHLELVVTVLRRVRLSAELIADLDATLCGFMDAAAAEGSAEAAHAALLLAKTLAEIGSCRALRRVCSIVVRECREHTENFGAAVGLGSELCRFPKCLQGLQEKGLRRILKSDRASGKAPVRELIEALR